MSKKALFLAGPLTGLSYGDALDWRTYVESKLPSDVIAFSALRGKEHVAKGAVLGAIAARVAWQTHRVRDVLPGGVNFRCGEDRAGLSRLLQRPQGLPGIGLIEEPIAVAGKRFPVQAAKVVEGQETACIDGDPQVLSIDLRRELGQGILIGRIIRPRRAHVISRPDDLRVAER